MIFLVFFFLVDVLLFFVAYVYTCLSHFSFHYMGFGPCPKGLDTGRKGGSEGGREKGREREKERKRERECYR